MLCKVKNVWKEETESKEGGEYQGWDRLAKGGKRSDSLCPPATGNPVICDKNLTSVTKSNDRKS